jgi:hypothetical protein
MEDFLKKNCVLWACLDLLYLLVTLILMIAPEDKNQGINYIVDSLYHGHEAMTGLPHHAVPNKAYNQVRDPM